MPVELSRALGQGPRVFNRSALPLVDTHCHLDFPEFNSDRARVLDRAAAAGVEWIVVPGCGPEPLRLPFHSRIRLSTAVGLHPHWVASASEAEVLSALRALPERVARERPVAIGECGLDRRPRYVASVALQRRALQFQVELAERVQLPLIVHAVRGLGEVLALLERIRPRRGGVLHAFSGSIESMQRLQRVGFYCGFGAGVLDERARRMRAAASRIQDGRLLLETDAPDQAPEGRGVRNEPATVLQVAHSIAALRGVAPATLAAQSTQNARGLFALEEAS